MQFLRSQTHTQKWLCYFKDKVKLNLPASLISIALVFSMLVDPTSQS